MQTTLDIVKIIVVVVVVVVISLVVIEEIIPGFLLLWIRLRAFLARSNSERVYKVDCVPR